MADTIREKIISSIKTTFENYSYVVLSSPTIVRGIEKIDPDIYSLPVISILPQIENSQRNQYNAYICTMPVNISCITALGTNNPSELSESILGELITIALSIDPTEASDILYTAGGTSSYYDEIGVGTLQVGVTIEVVYDFDLNDPFIQIT